jgi:hypothetical protein
MSQSRRKSTKRNYARECVKTPHDDADLRAKYEFENLNKCSITLIVAMVLYERSLFITNPHWTRVVG